MFKAGSLRSRIPHNFDPRAIYRVGVLEQATNIFAAKGFNFPNSHLPLFKQKSHGLIFVDLYGFKGDVDELLKQLRKPHMFQCKADTSTG